MATERFTITVPERLGKSVRRQARKQKKPVSRIIVEALEAQERERTRQRMIEGYIASREESRQIAEEFWPIAAETWPVD